MFQVIYLKVKKEGHAFEKYISLKNSTKHKPLKDDPYS
jgi:hypothetical protein